MTAVFINFFFFSQGNSIVSCWEGPVIDSVACWRPRGGEGGRERGRGARIDSIYTRM